MSILSTIELVVIIKELVGATYDKVSAPGFTLAAERAQQELSWTIPVADSKKEYWIVERSRRHLVYILLVESAHKFRFKEIHLHNRFAHYFKLLTLMDKEFEKAMDANPSFFEVDEGVGSSLFTYITPGFTYDWTGVDLTYMKGWN